MTPGLARHLGLPLRTDPNATLCGIGLTNARVPVTDILLLVGEKPCTFLMAATAPVSPIGDEDRLFVLGIELLRSGRFLLVGPTGEWEWIVEAERLPKGGFESQHFST